MQHFTTLGNAAYKFFKTFRANPKWAKCVGCDREVEYFREDKTAHVHNLVPTEIVWCLSLRKYSTSPVTGDTHCLRGISTECFEKLVSSISKGDKMLHFVYFFVFSFNTLDKGLNLLLLQLKWLEWENNGAELSTTDIGLYNGAEFGQSSGFILSMVKQLESPWNLATMCSKYFRYQYV